MATPAGMRSVLTESDSERVNVWLIKRWCVLQVLKPTVRCKKKLIVIPTTNLALTLKSNTMKNSMQNYKIFLKQCSKT